jgi:hypothetical protein
MLTSGWESTPRRPKKCLFCRQLHIIHIIERTIEAFFRCEMQLSKLLHGNASFALRERTGEAAARSATMAKRVPVDPDRSSDRRQEQGDEDGHQRSNGRARDRCDLRPPLELTAVTPAPARLSPDRQAMLILIRSFISSDVQERWWSTAVVRALADPGWR